MMTRWMCLFLAITTAACDAGCETLADCSPGLRCYQQQCVPQGCTPAEMPPAKSPWTDITFRDVPATLILAAGGSPKTFAVHVDRECIAELDVSSSDTSVARVEANGLVVAVKPLDDGVATIGIRVRSSDLATTVTVNVVP